MVIVNARVAVRFGQSLGFGGSRLRYPPASGRSWTLHHLLGATAPRNRKRLSWRNDVAQKLCRRVILEGDLTPPSWGDQAVSSLRPCLRFNPPGDRGGLDRSPRRWS